MINEVLLIITFISTIFLIIGIVYIIKLKRFEDERVSNPQNILIFGLFFLLIYLGISFLSYLDKTFHSTIIKISSNIPYYITTLNQISNIALIPLFMICLLVSLLVLKEI